MNLKELADLVVVRNHLTTLINDRSQINKDKLKIYSDHRIKLDRLFLEHILFAAPTPITKTGDDVKVSVSVSGVQSKNIEIKDGALIFNPNKDEQTGSIDIPIVEPVPATILNSDQKELEQSSVKVATGGTKKTSKLEVPVTDEDKDAIKASLAKAKKDLAKNKKNGKGPSFTRDTSASED